MRLLRIDASPRLQESHSRKMADLFQKAWLDVHPKDELIVRDLALDPVPHIRQATIQAFYAAPDELTPDLQSALDLSDQLIDELLSADIVILSTPMHNFSLPSVLKAYFDQVIRINRTFKVGEGGQYGPFVGLLDGKRVFVLTSSGAVFTDTALEPADALKPLLKTLFEFMGMREVEFFTVEGTNLDAEAFERTSAEVKQRIHHLLTPQFNKGENHEYRSMQNTSR